MNLSINSETMTEIPTIRKFLFTRSFDEKVDDTPQEPVFSAADVESAREQGFAEGYKSGQASTQEEQQAQFNILIEKVTQQLSSVTSDLMKRRKTQEQGISDIALAIVSKVLPAYIKAHGFDEIRPEIEQMMHDLSHEPRFLLHVNPSLEEPAKQLMDGLAQKIAYQGEVLVLSSDELGVSDCRIEWSDGGMQRDLKAFWSELDALIERTTGAPTEATKIMADADKDTQTPPSTEEVSEE